MRDDTDSIKLLISMANGLVNSNNQISLSKSEEIKLCFKFIMKIVVAFTVCVAMLVGCIIYALYQAYNYEGYSSNPTTIQNNNITGEDNKIEKGGN